MMDEKFIISRWGTPEEYFKELEAFHKAHNKADSITLDKNGNLVSAQYYFTPYQVAQKHVECLSHPTAPVESITCNESPIGLHRKFCCVECGKVLLIRKLPEKLTNEMLNHD